MNQFPIVFIPTEIRRIQQELPPLPPFTEQPPKLPGAEPQPISLLRIFVEVILLIAGTSGIYRISANAGSIALVFGIILLLTYQYLRYQKYKQSLHSYDRMLAAYFKSLGTYARRQVQREADATLARSPVKIREYQRPKLLEQLNRATARGSKTHNIVQSEVKTNFAQVLAKYFPDLIHVGWQVEQSNWMLVLDFAYIDLATNLHIAIDIEELSDLSNQSVERDREFDRLLDAGWIAIRFGRSQVERSPHSCCKAIAMLINDLLGAEELMHRFADIPDLL
jgi:hypothetical protein